MSKVHNITNFTLSLQSVHSLSLDLLFSKILKYFFYFTGCFCPAGTVELGDKCVAPEDCSSSNTTAVEEEQCPEGMVYRQCGSACPVTCENKDEDVNCVAVCVTGKHLGSYIKIC